MSTEKVARRAGAPEHPSTFSSMFPYRSAMTASSLLARAVGQLRLLRELRRAEDALHPVGLRGADPSNRIVQFALQTKPLSE